MRYGYVEKERGLITVEATVSLTAFILVALGVISFINIFLVHSRVQFAMYQTLKELSAYTYIYEVSGVRSFDRNVGDDLLEGKKPVDETISAVADFLDSIDDFKSETVEAQSSLNNLTADPSLESLQKVYGSGSSLVESGEKVYQNAKPVADKAKWIVQNPKDALRGLIDFFVWEGEGKLKQWALSAVSNGMLDKYLMYFDERKEYHFGQEFLQNFDVVDKAGSGNLLSYDKSSFFTDTENDKAVYKLMDLVVEYDIEVYMFKLFLKDPTIHVVQRLKMPAWLDGDGVSYTVPEKTS